MRLKLALADTIVLDPELGKLACRVGLRMLSYLNFRTLRMWPGAETLAAELDADPRNVKRALSSLCGPKGYFQRVPGTGRGPGNPTVYEARWDRAFEGARVAKARRCELEKGVKADTKGGKNAPLKGGSPDTRYLRGELSEKPCLLDTPSRGREGSGERGGEISPLADEPANGIRDAKVARQDDQAAGPAVAGPPSRQLRWRAAKARPLGPCERAAQHQRAKDRSHEDNQGNGMSASQSGAPTAPQGGAASQDGRRTGRDSGPACAAG